MWSLRCLQVPFSSKGFTGTEIMVVTLPESNLGARPAAKYSDPVLGLSPPDDAAALSLRWSWGQSS